MTVPNHSIEGNTTAVQVWAPCPSPCRRRLPLMSNAKAQAMRRVFYIHLALVAAAVLCYGYAEIRWTSVKVVGLHAFPGSPDWGGTFMSAYDSYRWMSGMLFGLLVAGLPISFLARAVQGMGSWRHIVPVAAIAVPALALVLGYAHEAGTVQVEARTSGARLNPVLERMATSLAQFERCASPSD